MTEYAEEVKMTDASRADDAMHPERGELSERDTSILAFEHQWWQHAGEKEEAIRAEFGLSSARYYQLLGALLDSPQALAHDPMLVKRLQRMRDARTRARTRRSLHGGVSQPNNPPTEDRSH